MGWELDGEIKYRLNLISNLKEFKDILDSIETFMNILNFFLPFKK